MKPGRPQGAGTAYEASSFELSEGKMCDRCVRVERVKSTRAVKVACKCKLMCVVCVCVWAHWVRVYVAVCVCVQVYERLLWA